MRERTRRDLEALFSYVEVGWEVDGPCLLSCMYDRWKEDRVLGYMGRAERNASMVAALGFSSEPGRSGHLAMYAWNDAYGRTKDEVLGRIKDALNGEFE